MKAKTRVSWPMAFLTALLLWACHDTKSREPDSLGVDDPGARWQDATPRARDADGSLDDIRPQGDVGTTSGADGAAPATPDAGAQDYCMAMEGTKCTTERCRAEGRLQCIDRELFCVRVDGKSEQESCNGIDDDCNGVVDDLGHPCCWPAGAVEQCPVAYPLRGMCRAPRRKCVVPDEGWTPCSRGVEPTDEICDGKDNDCDGDVDEDLPRPGEEACATGLPGVCARGIKSCLDGQEQCIALHARAEERCNGLDDDCDGEVDNLPGIDEPCATGLPGVCSDGVLACSPEGLLCEPSHLPSEEVCDGLDNDCNDMIDDMDPALDQDADGFVCDDCDPERAEVNPGAEEICDGLDNDCNGMIDDIPGVLGPELALTNEEQGFVEPAVAPTWGDRCVLVVRSDHVYFGLVDPLHGLVGSLRQVSEGRGPSLARVGPEGYLLAAERDWMAALVHLDADGEAGLGGVRAIQAGARPIFPIVSGCEGGQLHAVLLVDGQGLWLYRVDSLGRPAGERVLVTGHPATDASPAVVCTGSRWAVAWVDALDRQLYLQLIGLDGVPSLDHPLRVSNAPGALDPALCWGPPLLLARVEQTGLRPEARSGNLVVSVMTELGERVRHDGVIEPSGLASKPSLAMLEEQARVAYLDSSDSETNRVLVSGFAVSRPAEPVRPLLVTRGPGRARTVRILASGPGFVVVYDDHRGSSHSRVFQRTLRECLR